MNTASISIISVMCFDLIHVLCCVCFVLYNLGIFFFFDAHVMQYHPLGNAFG